MVWVFKVEDCLDPIYIFSVHRSDNDNFFHIDAIITTPEKNEPIET
jgi:hypothetical protein